MICKVIISKQAGKELEKLQRYVADLFFAWVLDIEQRGLEEVKKVPSFHDEPCKGKGKLKGLLPYREGSSRICVRRKGG